ncbi:MAG: DUF2298 domain-containing protein, partial [Chloroflexi bacterium]|nr:DUF2298 domain-containing protein [Chloroflexota bacterium]
MAYPVWLLSALKLTPHTAIVTSIAALFLVCAALLGAWKQRSTLFKIFQDNWHTILFIEVIYFIVFSLLCAFKAYSPAVQHTEQPMDLMILTSLMRSPQIPPPDVWLSGYPLSYYYGGYFCIAQVAQITHTPAAVAYNLGLVSGYATAFVTAFGIFLDIIPNTIKSASQGGLRKSFWALAGAIVLLVASNGAGVVLAFERLLQVAPTTWLRALGGTTAG